MVISSGAMSVGLPYECGCSNDLSHGSDEANANRGPHAGSYSELYSLTLGENKCLKWLTGLLLGPNIYLCTPMFVDAQG